MHIPRLLLALLLSVALASSSYRARLLSRDDIRQVAQIIDQCEDQPGQLAELFKDRRLRYSKDAKHLLSRMVSWYQPRLFKQFFKLIDFKPESRDGVMSRLLEVALFMGNAEVCAFLLKRGFQYIRKRRDPWKFIDMNSQIAYRPSKTFQSWDLDAFRSLVSEYPGIAAAICPQPKDSIDPEALLFLIEAAHHCAVVSEDPAVFDPTAWMAVVLRNRHDDAGFDVLMCRLCELGADVDETLVAVVRPRPIVFHQTYRFLRDAGFIVPASPALPVDGGGAYDLCLMDCTALSRILRGGEIPEAVTGLLDGCRFAFSHEMNCLLGCTISLNRPVSFAFFLGRTRLDAASRDEDMTGLLMHAFGSGSPAIYHQLLDEDFHIITGYAIFFTLDGWSLERAAALLAAHPQRGPDMAPPPESLQLSGNPEHARLMVDLASQCHPAGFEASAFLLNLLRNRRLEDADMAGAIRMLCELGARVEPITYEVLAYNNPQDYAESRQALQEHEAWQDEVKEPDCD